MNEKKSFEARIAELEISMEVMKDSNEDICRRSELISSENGVLNVNIKSLESSMVVLQDENDEVKGRLSGCIVENEETVSRMRSLSEK